MKEDRAKPMPVWFFTNERIGIFFSQISGRGQIRKIFSIGGAGDFAFSLLSQANSRGIEEINLCDIRPMAEATIEFKISLYKKFKYLEIIDLFWGGNHTKFEPIYNKIKSELSLPTRTIVKNCGEDEFLVSLKKSGLWYKESWLSDKDRDSYLPYLASEVEYNRLQKNINKITSQTSDFMLGLENHPNNNYDLVYTSNIFDSPLYCKTPDQYLQTIQAKLKSEGLLFIITQNNPLAIVKLVENQGFHLCAQEIHKFTPLSLFSKHYSYSFLLFRK